VAVRPSGLCAPNGEGARPVTPREQRTATRDGHRGSPSKIPTIMKFWAQNSADHDP